MNVALKREFLEIEFDLLYAPSIAPNQSVIIADH